MRKPALILLFLLAMGLAPSATADPMADLDAAGDRLATATEEYNQARLNRAALDEQLRAAQGRVATTTDRLDDARSRLGVAVRDLYMHPGSNMNAYFQAKSAGQLQRGNALAGFASVSIDQLILDVRKAKAAESATARRLEALRDEAKREENAMAARQRDAQDALSRTRRLLADRALAQAVAARRRADLDDAADLALERLGPAPTARASAAKAIATAAAQIGDPYQWGAAGPDRFDCSGLTMYAWAAAGVSLPHSSRAQFASLPKVALSEVQPGDLVFRGNPIHHVGIYEGNGVVIHSPQSGESVHRTSLFGARWNSMAARP
jgi:cell wall-associated NlpC family hydrolase